MSHRQATLGGMTISGSTTPRSPKPCPGVSQKRRTNRIFSDIALALLLLGFVNIGAWTFLPLLVFCYALIMVWRLIRALVIGIRDVALGRVDLLASRPSRCRPYSGGGAADSSGCGD